MVYGGVVRVAPGRFPRVAPNGECPWEVVAVSVWSRLFHSKDVELITDARRSPYDNWLHRKRVYNILQGLRIPFLLLSALTYLVLDSVWLSAVLFVVSVPLPWIAVVIANGAGEPQDSRAPKVYKPQVAREACQGGLAVDSGSSAMGVLGTSVQAGGTQDASALVCNSDDAAGDDEAIIIDHDDDGGLEAGS